MNAMRPFDPTPYAAIYVIIVFLCPWMVFAYLLWREWSFARSRGIIVTAQNWRTEWLLIVSVRRNDE